VLSVVVVLALLAGGALALIHSRRHTRSTDHGVLFRRERPSTGAAGSQSVPESSNRSATNSKGIVSAIVLAGLALFALVDFSGTRGRVTSTHSLDGSTGQVTSERGVEALPALSPDGEWIAYRSETEGVGDIVVRQIDGERVLNLTGSMNADESDPAFSPDGRHIAFRSTYGNGGIFVVDREGGTARRLTNFGSSPAWTPDGRSLVFATRSSMDPGSWNGVSEGWIVSVESGQPTRLTRHDFRQPSVSPDGRRIAYWSSSQPMRTARTKPIPGIWTIGIRGGYSRPISRGQSTDWNPVWSPDGEFLYFLSDRGGRKGIWRVSMNQNGTARSEPVRLSSRSDNAAHLAIATDGRHLAWSTLEWSPALFRVAFEPDTRSTSGKPTPVARRGLPWRCAEPSPDGSTIAFASAQQHSDIYLLRVNNGDQRRVTADQATESCPRWSPDGDAIIFHSDAGGANRLWMADADGTGLRLAATGMGDLTNPVWSPDGKSVVAWDGFASTLRVIRLDGERRSSSAVLPAPPHPFLPVSWSPDGTTIAGTAAGTVWLYNLASRLYEPLVSGSGPAWLSTSRRLIFASDGRLMMLDLPSRYTREILAVPDLQLDAPFLSPDDRHLYFNRNNNESNIWLLTLR
jgi:Tol biopolymer transport system component